MTDTWYIVQTASDKPVGKWATYGRVAVLEVDAGVDHVSSISERAKHVVRVVKTWDRLSGYKKGGSRTAFARALADAQELAARLNREAHS